VSDLRLLLIDCDGVLTDGTVSVDQDGRRFKTFHSRDARAIDELVALGWEVHVVSASGWPGLGPYLERTRSIVHVDHAKTTEALRDIVRGRPYVAVGDDVWDLEMLAGAAQAYCPWDSDCAVLEAPRVRRLSTCGGRGVLAELVRRLRYRDSSPGKGE